MTRHRNGRSLLVILSVACLVVYSNAQATQEQANRNIQNSAVEVLDRYLNLRLHDADWKDYSKYIAWPDEPSWDCKWVVKSYERGKAQIEDDKVIVPVNFLRLGLFCYDFEFESDLKKVTINYELSNSSGSWKIISPIPDYPEIGAEELKLSLRIIMNNTRASNERRLKAESTIRKIDGAIVNIGGSR